MSSTLGLVLAMLLGFGVVFEVPVILAFLSLIGVVSAQRSPSTAGWRSS